MKEEIKNKPGNTSSNPSPSNPGFWTDLISKEERKKTSEEAIQLIEAKFASTGMSVDDLETWILGFNPDWKYKFRNCYTRGEFNIFYNQMLDAIERAVDRKKNKKRDGKEEKKETKRGFATKEEADEYARRKQTEYKKSSSSGSVDSKGENSSSTQPKSETNFSSTNSQENKTIGDSLKSSESNNQFSNNNVPNREIKSDKDNQQPTPEVSSDKNDLSNPVLQGNYQEKQREELEKLKKTIDSLQNQQSSFQNGISQQSLGQQPNSNNNNFPWMIVIPMGGIILIFGGIILFLLGKRKS